MGVSYHDPSEDGKPNIPEKIQFRLSVKEGANDVKTMILGAKDKEGQPVFKEDETHNFAYLPISSSPIKGIDVYSHGGKTDLSIDLVDDPSTDDNELNPFVTLAN